MNVHGKHRRYLFARFDRYRFAHFIISRDSRVSPLPILIKSHTWHSGNVRNTFRFQRSIFPDTLWICACVGHATGSRVRERARVRTKARMPTHITPARTSRVNNALIILSIPRISGTTRPAYRAGRCSQPLRSSARPGTRRRHHRPSRLLFPG
jgi:hypothetical protein